MALRQLHWMERWILNIIFRILHHSTDFFSARIRTAVSSDRISVMTLPQSVIASRYSFMIVLDRRHLRRRINFFIKWIDIQSGMHQSYRSLFSFISLFLENRWRWIMHIDNTILYCNDLRSRQSSCYRAHALRHLHSFPPSYPSVLHINSAGTAHDHTVLSIRSGPSRHRHHMGRRQKYLYCTLRFDGS
ncbi:hypothetical protein SISSUDRAFT_440855 [Sistotremastrum suecicum HHB10207 ss-3]|uniref:Uncharacterized protein n=1 Tax=Sistotremastrum suecicum HHB10207 ss-3 TaxID=1314776 RepID=A0A166FK56_9AGAM|nr:hypothetical protein SISSUDRAFT_440855 [Sistotremastrum suecicum HHB10207 ss-3]